MLLVGTLKHGKATGTLLMEVGEYLAAMNLQDHKRPHQQHITGRVHQKAMSVYRQGASEGNECVQAGCIRRQ